MQRSKVEAKYSRLESEVSVRISSHELSLAYQELDNLIKLADTMGYSLVKIYAKRIENNLNKIEVCQTEYRLTQAEI